MSRTALFSFVGALCVLAVLWGTDARSASEVGVVTIPFDPVTGQYATTTNFTIGGTPLSAYAESGQSVVYDAYCFYSPQGDCRPRGGQSGFLQRICQRGTGEGFMCGMVIEFEYGGDGGEGTGAECTPAPVCSGRSVIDSCSGALLQSCSLQCISGSCVSGDGDDGHGGVGGGDDGAGGGDGTGADGGSGTGDNGNGECTSGPICGGTDLYHQNADCSSTLVEQCAFGCAQNACITSTTNAPVLVLLVSPPLVRKGSSCTLTFSAQHVTGCSLTGVGVSHSVVANEAGVVETTAVTTPGLTYTTPYTLTCEGSTSVSKTVDCKVTPVFQEF
jgi:hypothetical protein